MFDREKKILIIGFLTLPRLMTLFTILYIFVCKLYLCIMKDSKQPALFMAGMINFALVSILLIFCINLLLGSN